MLLASHPKPVSSSINKRDANLIDQKMVFLMEKIHVRKLQTQATKASKLRINTFFMLSSFSFLRYGHQTADIKSFPKLTLARLFTQEPRKKLFLRRREASLKIFEDKACKAPMKNSFFAAFVSLVKTLFISTSALSYGYKRPHKILKKTERGPRRRRHFSWSKLGKKFPSL